MDPGSWEGTENAGYEQTVADPQEGYTYQEGYGEPWQQTGHWEASPEPETTHIPLWALALTVIVLGSLLYFASLRGGGVTAPCMDRPQGIERDECFIARAQAVGDHSICDGTSAGMRDRCLYHTRASDSEVCDRMTSEDWRVRCRARAAQDPTLCTALAINSLRQRCERDAAASPLPPPAERIVPLDGNVIVDMNVTGEGNPTTGNATDAPHLPDVNVTELDNATATPQPANVTGPSGVPSPANVTGNEMEAETSG